MQRPSSSRSRPQTAGSHRPRSANVQAFQRGKEAAQLDALELCRTGLSQVSAQLLASFQSELQKLGSTLEQQVQDVIEGQQQRAEEKLDSILQALQRNEIGRGRSESPKQNYFAGLAHDCGQIEANRKLVKRRDEQIGNMLVLLDKLDKRGASFEKWSHSMEENLERAFGKVEMMDSYLRTNLNRNDDVPSIVSSRSPRSNTAKLERAESQQFMKKADIALLQQQMSNDTRYDVDDVYKEVKTIRKIANNNFRAMIKEVSRIQQALNLDFVVASESEDSDYSDSSGPGVSRRPSVSLTFRAAPSLKPVTVEQVEVAEVALPVAVAGEPAPVAAAAEITEVPATAATPKSDVRSILALSPSDSGREAPRLHRVSSKPSTSRPQSPSGGRPGLSEDATVLPVVAKRFKRVREFWTQTSTHLEERGAQTDPMRPAKKKTEMSFAGSLFGSKKDKSSPSTRGLSVNDLDTLKARARKALMRPQYDVTSFYKKEGCFQALARSNLFDQITVIIVCINAVWIAVDTDLNDALFLSEADPIFQIVENLFCAYFFLEVCVRFGAFESKCRAFMDKWFVFDTLLVLNMVVETWILPLLFLAMGDADLGNTIDVSMLRMLRLVKLTRLSRISRLLRSVPELAIIVKAIGLSARSVSVFFALWLVLIYVFAITLRQLSAGTDFGDSYFKSVPDAMDTLLLDGILADYAPLMHAVPAGHIVEWILILFFILLASITIMYMLVGVLVEVVGALAHAEKESITVSYIASCLRKKMEQAGHDEESELSRTELQDILLDPDITEVLQSVQVDLVALMELVNIAYEDAEKTGSSMTFEKIVSLVLNGRGQNTACVKDTSELLRILKQIIIQRTSEVSEKFQDEIASVHRSLHYLQQEQDADDDSPKDEETSSPSPRNRKTVRGEKSARKYNT